jgi:soluble lytic murein transglycosylase-like protein
MIRGLVLVLAVVAQALTGSGLSARAAEEPAKLDALIAACAAEYGLPEILLHRVIKRESNYNAAIHHRGHWGLMQIKYATARSMGYRGPARDLLNPEINLKYGGKYLAGAYLVASGNVDRAMRLYRSGYYYEAKRKGLLEETGLKPKKK